MAANINDNISRVSTGTRPPTTTVDSTRSVAGATLVCADLAGWSTDDAVHFVTYKIDGQGTVVAGSQTDMKGIVSGNSITNVTITGGTDVGNVVGDVVQATPTAAWAKDLGTHILTEHNQDGTHKLTDIVNNQTTKTNAVGADKVLILDSAASDAAKKTTVAGILQLVYPVGSIYISVISTNPATLFGFGTWSAFATGRTLVGIDAGQTEFDAVEETGGAKTHTHQHISPVGMASGNPYVINQLDGNLDGLGSYDFHSIITADRRAVGAGGSASVEMYQVTSSSSSSLPPYIVTYMWKRTA